MHPALKNQIKIIASYCVPPTLLLAVTSFFAMGSVSIGLVITIYLSLALITFFGSRVLALSRFDHAQDIGLLSLPVGMSVVMPLMCLLCFYLTLSAVTAFFAVSAVLAFALRRSNSFMESQRSDFMIVLWMVIVVLLVSFIPVRSFFSLPSGGEFGLWSDFFIHGVTVNMFGSPFLVGQGDPFLAGNPIAFYHYAAFLYPAFLTKFLGLSGLAMAVSILLPLGLFLALLGIYLLGSELGGRTGGVVSLLLILLFPWPVTYTGASFYDHMWSLYSSPGTGYAIGISCVALVLLSRFLKGGGLRVLILSLACLASLVLFRVHMFLVLAPAYFFALAHHYLHRKGIILVLGLSLLLFSPLVFPLFESDEASKTFLASLSSYMHWSLLDSTTLKRFVELFGFYSGARSLAQLWAILYAVGGAFLVAAPWSVFKAIQQREHNSIDSMPLFIVFSFAMILLFAPTAYRDTSEFKHRHFTLVYALLVIFTASALVRSAPGRLSDILASRRNLAVLILVTCLAITAWSLRANPAAPRGEIATWGLFDQKLSFSSNQIAEYIRDRSQVGDKIAFDHQETKELIKGPAMEVLSFSGLPAFLARREFQGSRPPIVAAEAMRREKFIDEVLAQSDVSIAMRMLKDSGIRWFVVFHPEVIQFDRQGLSAA